MTKTRLREKARKQIIERLERFRRAERSVKPNKNPALRQKEQGSCLFSFAFA